MQVQGGIILGARGRQPGPRARGLGARAGFQALSPGPGPGPLEGPGRGSPEAEELRSIATPLTVRTVRSSGAAAANALVLPTTCDAPSSSSRTFSLPAKPKAPREPIGEVPQFGPNEPRIPIPDQWRLTEEEKQILDILYSELDEVVPSSSSSSSQEDFEIPPNKKASKNTSPVDVRNH